MVRSDTAGSFGQAVSQVVLATTCRRWSGHGGEVPDRELTRLGQRCCDDLIDISASVTFTLTTRLDAEAGMVVLDLAFRGFSSARTKPCVR